MSRLTQRTFVSAPAADPGLSVRCLVALALLSVGLLIWQLLDPRAFVFSGIQIDRLTAISALFISVVGAVVLRFATRAMQGHPARDPFLQLLGIAISAAVLVAVASSLLLLALGWILLGLAVTRLVGFEDGSLAVRRAALRHAWVARASDAALMIALALMAWRSGSLDLSTFLSMVPSMTREQLAPIAILVSLAACARSVQVPFHVWLPATAEAPTPVSALLHAGIVNAGGLLLIRTAALIVRVPEAWVALAVVGSLSIAMGTLVVWHQSRVKHALAWSTVSQMGFMTAQCGLAAFPAALLHLMGHGSYKALAFLRSGERPAPQRPVPHPVLGLALLLLGSLAAWICMPLATRWTGFDPAHSAGEMGLSVVIALGVGQLWSAVGASWSRVRISILEALFGSMTALLVPLTCFAFYRACGWFLKPVLGELPSPTGPVAWVAAATPVVVMFALSTLHACRSALETSTPWRWLRVQAASGFHGSAILDRLVESARYAPAPDRSDIIHA